jgi:8-oxo-dGTP pyrophosphatase MutT (NUDIX family)
VSESPASNDAPATDKSPTGASSRRARRGRRRKPSRPADNSVDAARSESSGVAGTTATEGRTAQVKPSDVGKSRMPAKVPPNLAKQRLRTVRETSAGGLMVSGLDGPGDERCAALIGRVDRRGRMMWSLPKGHIETGETAEQTAIREVAEETGIKGNVVAPLGKIDYWFVSEGKRIHKTVHHYLMRFTGGELSDADYEVAEVAWVPLADLPRRLTYSDERRLARVADDVIAELTADPDRMAESEALGARTEPNAYEKAAAARNQKRNEPPAPTPKARRRRRRGRRGSGRGSEGSAGRSGGAAANSPTGDSGPSEAT